MEVGNCSYPKHSDKILFVFLVNVLASLINTDQSTFIPFLTILQLCLD
jgi:hypothetical protein